MALWLIATGVLLWLSWLALKPTAKIPSPPKGCVEQRIVKALTHTGTNSLSCVLDLEGLASNVDAICHALPDGLKLRISTKSIPCLDMIEFVMRRANTQRLMVFQPALLSALVSRFGDTADYMCGVTFDVRSVRHLMTELSESHSAESARPLPEVLASCVQWLIDTPERLQEYLRLAQELSLKLRVCIEVDIGMHRGGVRSTGALLNMCKVGCDARGLRTADTLQDDTQQLEAPRGVGNDGV